MTTVAYPWDIVVSEPMLPLPALPEFITGVVGRDPWVVQCADCGRTATHRSITYLTVLGRWIFHLCEGRGCPRRCRDCLAAAVAACPEGRCKR